MTKSFKIDNIRLINYIGWAGLLAIVQLFFLENINLLSIVILIFLNTLLGVLIEFLIGNYIYNEWWKSSFLLNRTTCACSSCNNWVENHLMELLVKRSIISILIVIANLSLTPITTNVDVSIHAKILERKIKSNYITPTVSVIGILNKELIKGKKGNYYKVELSNATHNEKVLFPTGKYVIDELDNNLLIPVNSFTDSVYRILEKGFDCKLYVRGIADQLGNNSFRGNFDMNYSERQGFSRFSIYPKEHNYYISKERQITIKSPFNNSHLPNLRGRFLQNIFENYFQDIETPKILEGRVTDNISREDRSGFLLMYVDWESNKFTWLPEWLKQLGLLLFSFLSFRINFDVFKWLKVVFKIK